MRALASIAVSSTWSPGLPLQPAMRMRHGWITIATGLHDRDGKGAYPPDNTGLVEHTGRPEDMGRFRTPSLRNVELTAPYMHDGSIATLEEAIAHYAAGGRRRSPLTSEFLPGFTLSAEETQDLIAFLRALTDRRFIEDARFADPWPAGTRFVQP